MQRLPPLAQRLHSDFTTDTRFDNPRAVQIHLGGFDLEKPEEVGRRVRDLYAAGAPAAERILHRADERVRGGACAGRHRRAGGNVGGAPRIFLKKLVGDVLDRIDQFPDFDPRRDYALTLADHELTAVERGGRPASNVDDVELEL